MVDLVFIAVLGCALTYTVGTLFLKEAFQAKTGIWQVNVMANLMMAVLYLPCWGWTDFSALHAYWYEPVVASATFLLGQFFSFAALKAGDVSVATPVLGSKVILVTLLASMVFGDGIPAAWWIGAGFSTLGILVVTWPGSRPATERRSLAWTALYALLAATFFSLTDLGVQHWSKGIGIWGFIAAMYTSLGFLTLAVYGPMLGKSMMAYPSRQAAQWLSTGCFLWGAQNLLLTLALRWKGDATAVNIVYSSRCIWTVGLAWLMARRLRTHESVLGWHVMALRLFGACLIFSAVWLVVRK